MDYQEIWQAVWPYLAETGVATGSVFGLVMAFGGKVIENRFKKTIEEHKHVLNKDLENVRFEINKSYDRATKINQREFEIYPEIWSRLNVAYWKCWDLRYDVPASYTFDGQTDEAIARFAESEGFSVSEVSALMASSDRLYTFQNTKSLILMKECQRVYNECRTFVLANSIFIDPQADADIREILRIIIEAMSEASYNMYKRTDKKTTAAGVLMSVGAQKLDILEVKFSNILRSRE